MSKLDTIQTALTKWAQWLVPTSSVKENYNFRSNELSYSANQLDVNRLRYLFASAESGNVMELFAMYRDVMIADPHIQAEFAKRKLAMLGDTIIIQPADKKIAADRKAADFVKSQVLELPAFTSGCGHLLDGILWPVAIGEKVYRNSSKPGVRFELDQLNTVQAGDIDFTTGKLMLRKLDPNGGYLTGVLEEADPNRYIIHRGHLLTHADFWGGPMRSLMFWWLLRSMTRDWWARFLERYGSPFIVGKYNQSDDESRAILSQAFSAATKIFGLVVSKETEVELIQASTAMSGEAFKMFLNDACNDEISRFIVGQSSSAGKGSSGLNSGKNQQHENVRQDLRQFDAKMLAETLRDQLFKPLLWINGFEGATPRILFGGLAPEDQKSIGSLISDLSNAGLEPTDEGIEILSDQLGVQLQRKALPTMGDDPNNPGGPPRPFSAPGLLPLGARGEAADRGQLAVDRVAANGAAKLSRAFRGSLAPVRQIILESSSAEECEHNLRTFYADWSPDKIAPVLNEALMAFAANGAAHAAREESASA